MASGSQDATIRLWNIEPIVKIDPHKTDTESLSDDLLDAFEASLSELAEAEEGGRQISLKKHILTVKDRFAYLSAYNSISLRSHTCVTALPNSPSLLMLSLLVTKQALRLCPGGPRTRLLYLHPLSFQHLLIRLLYSGPLRQSPLLILSLMLYLRCGSIVNDSATSADSVSAGLSEVFGHTEVQMPLPGVGLAGGAVGSARLLIH